MNCYQKGNFLVRLSAPCGVGTNFMISPEVLNLTVAESSDGVEWTWVRTGLSGKDQAPIK